MLRCGSPLGPLGRAEVIHLPRSDVALCFHTRLKVQPEGCLQRPTKVGAVTGSLSLVQKKLAGFVHWVSGFVAFFLKAFSLQPFRSSGGTCRAMAQTKPLSSRARAVMTTGAFLRPGPLNCL